MTSTLLFQKTFNRATSCILCRKRRCLADAVASIYMKQSLLLTRFLDRPRNSFVCGEHLTVKSTTKGHAIWRYNSQILLKGIINHEK